MNNDDGIIKKYWNELLNEFSSIQLAITLLIFLAITTLIGTVLPQEPMVSTQSLIEKYGVEKFKLYKSFGLTDVFHSWWYLALLTAFGLNLTAASFRRVFPKWKIAFLLPNKIKNENIAKLPVTAELPASGDLNISKVEKKLAEKKYKTKIIDGQLLAMKGGIHRLGASVTHVGIMILLVGSTFSILTGYNGMVQLSENEGFYVADLGQSSNQMKSAEKDNWLAPIKKMPIWFGQLPEYLIKVKKTWRENYNSGDAKQWYSELEVLDKNKKKIYKKTIHVNDPLQYRGLDVYQSNWGRFADIAFNDERSTFPLETVGDEELVFVPLSMDLGFKFKVEQGKEDNLEVSSILVKDKIEQKLLGKVKADDSLQIGPMKITYFGTKTLTGLQFKSNPGDLLIYPGVIFMIIGVLIAFGSKKQLWVASEQGRIIIGGNADRSLREFKEEFEQIIRELIK